MDSESLKTYILEELGVRVYRCEQLTTRSQSSKCFKVNLDVKDRDKLLSPDVWPEDIVCRKFFNKRKNQS